LGAGLQAESGGTVGRGSGSSESVRKALILVLSTVVCGEGLPSRGRGHVFSVATGQELVQL
jgi:hypothetical protein